jgi:hypothetical protein
MPGIKEVAAPEAGAHTAQDAITGWALIVWTGFTTTIFGNGFDRFSVAT